MERCGIRDTARECLRRRDRPVSARTHVPARPCRSRSPRQSSNRRGAVGPVTFAASADARACDTGRRPEAPSARVGRPAPGQARPAARMPATSPAPHRAMAAASAPAARCRRRATWPRQASLRRVGERGQSSVGRAFQAPSSGVTASVRDARLTGCDARSRVARCERANAAVPRCIRRENIESPASWRLHRCIGEPTPSPGARDGAGFRSGP